MRHGDLSNKMLPRLIVAFEKTIGSVPADKEKQFAKALSKKRFSEAISCFELNETVLDKLLYLRWKKDTNISVVTWMGDDAAAAIEELMDEEGIPIGNVFASTPQRLARSLAYSPDVIAVYDSDSAHVFTYGAKGVLLTDANQLGRF